MTLEEEQAVAQAVAQISGQVLQRSCFQTQEEAETVSYAARVHSDLPNLFTEADVIDLSNHNMGGYVVRVVAGSDGQVGVMFKGGRCYQVPPFADYRDTRRPSDD